MEWEKVYKEKLMTAEEAINRFVHSNQTIGIGGMALASAPLLAIFDKIKKGELTGITMVGDLLTDFLPLDDPNLTPDKFRYNSVFFGGFERKGYAARNTAFIPTQFHHYTKIIETIHPNVAVIPFSMPDENGYCNIGPINACINPVVVENSDVLIAQVSPNMPRACGHESLQVHVSKMAAIVESNQDILEFPVAKVSEIDQQIANNILPLIPDGACIQLGLGGTANAVGYGLKEKKHLGIHTEMFTESMMWLQEQGIIDNSRKTFMPGVSVAGFTLGRKGIYDFCNSNKDTYFGPFSMVNDVANISKNDNMISINNAVSVDLFGQICAESMGFRQFSGTGGQVDYVRGALHSKGGKSFIALPSTYTDKAGVTHSKIVLDFDPGAVTTTLRSDVQYIVTEFGCVNLFAKDLVTRAKLLISIAHPDFREELTFAAKKNNLLY